MATSFEIRRHLRKLISFIARKQDEQDTALSEGALVTKLLDVFLRTWDLGFTAFGGPPVHFQIIHARFVAGKGGAKWIDEQTVTMYQELFALCQSLPGPVSTKMLFCVTMLHAGFIPALFVLFLWIFPGALVMYALSLGVQRINETLPPPVYALLSGLNASIVGIIALAAVQLAERAITDNITRLLVIFGACAGVCYNALWYFPILMLVGGFSTSLWDGFLKVQIAGFRAWRRRRENTADELVETVNEQNIVSLDRGREAVGIFQRRVDAGLVTNSTSQERSEITVIQSEPATKDHAIRVDVGISVIVLFFASFAAVMLVRGLVRSLPVSFSLFANMYLAGTIIFGGGPVVIPLLRSYVVDPGWVSGRDFLLGLAIIQAMPGPNFNFAVYLGALTLQKSSVPTVVGAILALVGIFTPGVTLAVAVQGFWRVLRKKRYVSNILRGMNAVAVGLVFTAVYRLWEIGYLTPETSAGSSLALNPWWVVVTVVSYAETAWFKVPPAIAITVGAVLGLCWYGAVDR